MEDYGARRSCFTRSGLNRIVRTARQEQGIDPYRLVKSLVQRMSQELHGSPLSLGGQRSRHQRNEMRSCPPHSLRCAETGRVPLRVAEGSCLVEKSRRDSQRDDEHRQDVDHRRVLFLLLIRRQLRSRERHISILLFFRHSRASRFLVFAQAMRVRMKMKTRS